MKPTLLPIPLALVACSTLALGGCGAFENFGGNKKVSPDEFKIVSHSPLTMPPNAELRPPRPGEPRPQEVTPADQAKEALNFQITVALAMFVSFLLMLVVIGFFLLGLVCLAALVLTIIAGIKANEGKAYRYPFCLRLIK